MGLLRGYVTTLFEVLSAWSKYWDRLELTNLPIHSTLLKKIWHQKRKNLPFKYKIKTMDSVSYVKLYQEDKITDWDAWVDNQSTSTKKMLLKSAPLNQATNSKADVNTLETQKTNIDNLNQLSKSLSEVVDNQHTASLNKLNRSRITLSFIKRFTYYNKHNNWVVHFDCLKNQIKLSTQYAILDNNNCYYLTTSNVSRTTSKNVSKAEELILQSSVLKSCFDDKISRFYLNNSLPAFFKNWKTENENRFQIIIYNKSKKWF